MTDEDPQPRTFREMVRVLRAFEGRRCTWRISAAAVIYGAIHLLPVIGAVAGIYVGAPHIFPRIVLGVVVSLGFGAVAARISRRTPWRALLENRLRTYEEPNPLGFVELLVQDHDVTDADRALRRARFTPLYGARVPTPPPDAPELTARIGVQESTAWMRSTSDHDRLQRIATILAAAGIRARVGGVDAFPGAPLEPRTADAPVVKAAAASADSLTP